jgi:NADPH:quinone reductase
MKALTANSYGPPAGLVVADVPEPVPGPGHVLVRMEAAALNPFDLKLITGAMRDSIPVEFPYVPGMDGAGIVAGLGQGVARVSPGDRVFGFFGETHGTMAEYAVIPDGPLLCRRPGNLDATNAAAIPESGLTALSLVRAAQLQRGQSLLVLGASGGVGMFVVQLAAADGAAVLATAGPEDADYVRDLGATDVLDYHRSDVIVEALRHHPDGVDVVIDLINAGLALTNSSRAVGSGGRLVSSLGGPDATTLGRSDITVTYTGLSARREPDLDELGASVAAGSLRVELGRLYTLDEARHAFVDFGEKHTRGKLVVTV